MNYDNTKVAVGAGVVIILLMVFFGFYLLNKSSKNLAVKKADIKVSATKAPNPTVYLQKNGSAAVNTAPNTMPKTGVGDCDACNKYLTGQNRIACLQQMNCSY